MGWKAGMGRQAGNQQYTPLFRCIFLHHTIKKGIVHNFLYAPKKIHHTTTKAIANTKIIPSYFPWKVCLLYCTIFFLHTNCLQWSKHSFLLIAVMFCVLPVPMRSWAGSDCLPCSSLSNEAFRHIKRPRFPPGLVSQIWSVWDNSVTYIYQNRNNSTLFSSRSASRHQSVQSQQ